MPAYATVEYRTLLSLVLEEQCASWRDVHMLYHGLSDVLVLVPITSENNATHLEFYDMEAIRPGLIMSIRFSILTATAPTPKKARFLAPHIRDMGSYNSSILLCIP